MSDITTIPPVDPECAAHEALKSAAHSRPIWITKPDGTKVNLAELLCCMVEALGEAAEPIPPKPLTQGGLVDCTTGLTAWIEYPCDGAGGYDYSSPTVYTIDPETGEATETTMLEVTTSAANAGAEICETLDCQVTITEAFEGTAADIIADALDLGKEFPTYGAPTEDDAIALTGTAAGPMTYGGFTGDTVKDTDGVTDSTPIVITADCLPATFNVCFRKCLSAAEIKALPAKEG